MIRNLGTAVLLSAWLAGCSKSDFLSQKPDQSLVVPTTLQDFQAILDNDNAMNGELNQGVAPSLGEIATTDYYISDSNYYKQFNEQEELEYIWAVNPYPGADIADWDKPYTAILYANEVITGISGMNVPAAQQTEWNNLMGSAHFYRAFFFYNLAQIFSPPYQDSVLDKTYGIPLRMSADINESLHRSTVADTYKQIIQDLEQYLSLLPVQASYPTRPCRPAAYALLARVFMSMRKYDSAYTYAEASLGENSTLMDFYTLDSANQTVQRSNPENLFDCLLLRSGPTLFGFVDSSLFRSYDTANGDLRPKIFYGGNPGYLQKSYDGSFNPYGGIATDEVYLMHAECAARNNDTGTAMNDLRTLLSKRYRYHKYISPVVTSVKDVLALALSERRKELVMRGIRWMDLRRLNFEPTFEVTLHRTCEGFPYTLLPNSNRYTYPIPDNVMSANPTWIQNPQ